VELRGLLEWTMPEETSDGLQAFLPVFVENDYHFSRESMGITPVVCTHDFQRVFLTARMFGGTGGAHGEDVSSDREIIRRI
jgi:hypothetical protein